MAVASDYSAVNAHRRFTLRTVADPEGVGAGGPDPSKNHKYTRFLSNTGPNPLKKSQRYQASIQCWAIIGPPAKCN